MNHYFTDNTNLTFKYGDNFTITWDAKEIFTFEPKEPAGYTKLQDILNAAAIDLVQSLDELSD
jgi:hypothetical protein